MQQSYLRNQLVLFSGDHRGRFKPLIESIQRNFPQIQIYNAVNYYNGLQVLLSLSIDLLVTEAETRTGDILVYIAAGRRIPVLVIIDGHEAPDYLQQLTAMEARFAHSGQTDQQIMERIEATLFSSKRRPTGKPLLDIRALI